MRGLIIFLLLLVASVWATVAFVNHPGFLFIVYQPWMVQMPLWFAVFALLIILGLFYCIIASIDSIHFLWFRFKNWLRFRREHKAYSKTQHGMALLIEGRFKKAEKLLLAGASKSVEEPLINYLGAAKAAQEQGEFSRRDTYLQKAYQLAPSANIAIGLVQAELEFEHNQLEQAAATLNHLRHDSPRHPQVLKLLEKVYVRLADWKSLQALLPSMRKAKILNAEQTVLFEKNLYSEILQTTPLLTSESLHKMWNDIPRYMRKNPDVVCAYVKQLQRFSEHEEMEDLIRKTLKTHWQPELVKIYSTLSFTNLNRQLVIGGAWLKMYGPKPELLLFLGKLCVRIQLWGKAKDYFEKCLAEGPNAEASLEYGNLLLQLDEPEEAMQKYRDGLAAIASLEQ